MKKKWNKGEGVERVEMSDLLNAEWKEVARNGAKWEIMKLSGKKIKLLML